MRVKEKTDAIYVRGVVIPCGMADNTGDAPQSKEDIKKILTESDFSPLNTYRLLFESMNIEFSYDEDFIDYIAEKAIALNSGARSLKTVFDDTISSAMFRIFAGEYSSINLTRPTNDEKPYVLTKKR